MRSPLDKYPKPPFKSETQPWPGLAGQMDPEPDQPAELASIHVQLAVNEASFTTGNIYGAGGGQGQP